MKKIQLTTAEIEILITISMIMEFESENSGNIPNGGIDEIIVSNNIMESDLYERVVNSLCHYGLIDEEDFLTESGQNYIKQLKKDADNIKKDKNAVCVNDYSKVIFKQVKEWLKEIPWNKGLDNTYKISTIVNTLVNVANTLIQAFQ